MKQNFLKWLRDGTPWIWFNAGAVAISIVMVIGLLLLLAVRGIEHFWPKDVLLAVYEQPVAGGQAQRVPILGELVESEQVPASQIISSGIPVDEGQDFYQRSLVKLGNRDLTGMDFTWVLDDFVSARNYPADAVTLERREWGNFYGFLEQVIEDGQELAPSTDADRWQAFRGRLQRALDIYDQIYAIEKHDIGEINYAMERLRLEERSLELEGQATPDALARIDEGRAELDAEYQGLQAQLEQLHEQASRDAAVFRTAADQQVTISLDGIVMAYRPNQMNVVDKLGTFFIKLGEFLSAEPREANTEGGIFPAIFGTVLMVLLMSVFVTPFGVVAAIYLREYARQGFVTRAIRIAVNNLAGVPSIVYGVFGLGFFIYIIGGEIDQVFYPEALPAPTFGTPGLLWASLTLALLTVPVVIVATEEGLARIPRSVREGSLALGATKFETLWRVVLPMASPAMMTGLILAVARAAGEVAPLMLVGVVKLAPSLPLDGNYPYLHLDQKFMHLGFHIYDVGFQSPNVEAARPLVFATALLLVIVIAVLNLAAVGLRNRLREKFKALDE